MSRYIDADALMDAFSKLEFSGDMGDAMEILDNYPTIDAVPVVRCKDCKHSDTFPVCGEPYSFPLKCLSIRYGGVFEDWFCEHGERR